MTEAQKCNIALFTWSLLTNTCSYHKGVIDAHEWVHPTQDETAHLSIPDFSLNLRFRESGIRGSFLWPPAHQQTLQTGRSLLTDLICLSHHAQQLQNALERMSQWLPWGQSCSPGSREAVSTHGGTS